MGYHLRDIPKGSFGGFSKIQEEWEELLDAREQQSPILELVEFSDLLGAIEEYVFLKYNIKLDDIIKMKDATKRAFQTGDRQ